MKKLIALLLMLVVCVGALASCTVPDLKVPGALQPKPEDEATGLQKIYRDIFFTIRDIRDKVLDKVGAEVKGEEDPDQKEEGGVSIDDAATYLYNMYKDNEGKETRNDFDVVAKVTIDGVSFSVTWASDNEKVVIKESTKANFFTVDVPDVNTKEFEYKLTATIKSGDKTATKTFTRVVPVIDNSGIATQPEEGVAYKLFLYQGNKQKTLYALTTLDQGKFINTTEDPTVAPDFYAEADGDGYKFYTTIDGAKKYLEAYLVEDGTTTEGTTKWSKRLRFSDTATVWTYKAESNAWFTTIQDGPYVIGTYSNYTTISLSDGSFMTAESTGKSQFPLQLITSAYAEENGGVVAPDEHTCADANGDYICDTENCDVVLAPAANSTLTLAEAVKLAAALKGEYSTDKYFIVVTINEVYNSKYGNLYVSDATVEKFTVYGTYDATGDKGYSTMENAPVAGDTVTIWGVIGSYNGSAQMKDGWFTDEAPETPVEPETPVTKPAPEAGEYYVSVAYPEGTVSYLTGANQTGNNYRWLFDADKANAAKFELIAVEGGYNLKMTANGETKFMNIVAVASGEKTFYNFLAQDAADGVWKWNAEAGYLYVTIDGVGDYTVMQTGTYTNVEAKKVTTTGNIIALEAYVGSTEPETPVDPETPAEHTCVDANGDFKCDIDTCAAVMLPADGTALTIPQALAIAEIAGTSYTTQKYYITATIKNVYNTTYGNMYIKDADGNELCIYGLKSADGTARYDALPYKPVAGDEITIYTVLGMHGDTLQGKDAWLDDVVAHEHNYVDTVTAPTCVAEGYTTHTCSICNAAYTDTPVAALGHTTNNGTCGNCGLTIGGDTPVIGTLATFDFGANGEAAHVDGNALSTTSYTVGSYTLELTDTNKVYGPAYDATGNSCIKLGTSSTVGTFKFTVGENVTEVVIYVAKYKANTTKVNVNGTEYTISNASNDGVYDVITIDTSVTKTVTFTTVSGGARCMINTIEFKGNVA